MRAAWALAALVLLMPAGGCRTTLGPVTRIVLVTLDTTRADRLGCYGYERAETPNLDELAEESVLFEHAVSPVPTTLPAHGTIFTGLYPQDHGLRYNLAYRLRPEALTLAEALAEAGYTTAAFPGSFVLSRNYGIHQGFQTWAEPEVVTRTTADSQNMLSRNAEEVVDLTLQWLDGNAGRKTFVWAHFYDPHAPYLPPFPFSSRFRDRPYDGELAFTDAQLGRLFESLRNDPEWDRTLLVVSGDHGEGLHDHKELWHSNLVYETTQHVPLMLRAPGSRARRVEEPVGLADIMPTVLEAARVTVPENLRGSSLRPVLEGGRPPKRPLYFETLAGALNFGWAELKGVRFGRWKLIDSRRPELFDLEEDPGEENNLAAFESQTLADLRAQLAGLAESTATEELAAETEDAAMDIETERLLASLGYVAGGFGSSAEDAPEPRDVIDLESDLNAGQNAVANRDWARVEEVSRYLLERNPSNKWALRVLADALASRERFAEAEEFAARLVETYKNQPVGYATLAMILRAQDRREEALRALETGRLQVPGSERLAYLTIVAAFDLGRPVCEGMVAEALEEFPRSGLLRVFLARCEANAGYMDAAYETLMGAVAAGFRQIDLVLESEEFAAIAADKDRVDVLRGMAGLEGAPEVVVFEGSRTKTP